MSPARARLAWALATLSPIVPALALAQDAGASVPAPRLGFTWLWILAVALLLAAFFRVIFGPERRRREPPVQRP
jgi:hypothetical protein